MNSPATLKRVLTLPLVIFYGLGNILGAGIYVLIGKVAGYSSYYSPLAFLLASLVAALSALSYAELSSRYPVSAGEAVYLQKAFNFPPLSLFIGLLIVFAGCVSSGAIARGFAGYTRVFLDLPDSLILIILLSVLGAIACWGIRISVGIASLITIIEIVGLFIIIGVTSPDLSTVNEKIKALPSFDPIALQGIFLGAFLAFYAYIGFEDMVNIAEEVKDASRTMPFAILIALILATLLYSLVTFMSILSVSPETLNESEAPLALVYEVATGKKPVLITLISLFAVINGALIQIIMASRILYGSSKQGWLPQFLGKVNTVTHTPINSTLLCAASVLAFALWLPVETLARTTSYLILIIFTLVNLSLAVIKLRGTPAEGIFTVPLWIPVSGTLVSAAFVIIQIAISVGR